MSELLIFDISGNNKTSMFVCNLEYIPAANLDESRLTPLATRSDLLYTAGDKVHYQVSSST
jgi:hypothetical protein